MLKTCAKCNEPKPSTEFYKDSSRGDGLCSKCKCCAAVVHAAWRAANPEKHNANASKWAISNPEKDRAHRERYRANHPEIARARQARWRATNPESARIIDQNRRSRKSGGRLSKGLAEKLFELQRGKCACGCKQPLADDYHLDHIFPLALGGSNTDDNIQLLRPTCNHQKNKKHPVDFMRQRGFLL